jgi:hypothetical protein
MSRTWGNHKFTIHIVPANWTIGIVAPHGGMIVWTFAIGPLWCEFWPKAKKLETMPW